MWQAFRNLLFVWVVWFCGNCSHRLTRSCWHSRCSSRIPPVTMAIVIESYFGLLGRIAYLGVVFTIVKPTSWFSGQSNGIYVLNAATVMVSAAYTNRVKKVPPFLGRLVYSLRRTWSVWGCWHPGVRPQDKEAVVWSAYSVGGHYIAFTRIYDIQIVKITRQVVMTS